MFCLLVSFATQTVFWLVQLKVMLLVIATSDLWLFIHASNLLPSIPTPLPYRYSKTNTIFFVDILKTHILGQCKWLVVSKERIKFRSSTPSRNTWSQFSTRWCVRDVPACLSVRLSVSQCLPACLPVCLPVCPPMSSQRLVGGGDCQIKPCERRGGGECAVLPESPIRHCKQ